MRDQWVGKRTPKRGKKEKESGGSSYEESDKDSESEASGGKKEMPKHRPKRGRAT